MRQLELLAPARDAQIGIAAIDCGADAVYIAGPQFGARQAAGNTIEDIKRVCDYAHKFGARIFVALNTILYDDELEAAYRQMLAVQEAGADAIIVQDMAVVRIAADGIGNMKEDFHIPLHASTQCAIRTPEHAVFLEGLGFSRLILERELSLEQIRAIRKAVTCELEFFVHGALCVCYSGQCYLSEKIAGRSANRGACIQACRSRYDLVDSDGKVIVKDKALLSLKDYNLKARLEDLAEAGITSFKIEGRLKNESYVRNVVRDYSLALDEIVRRRPEDYERGSYGQVSKGFTPDTYKTFNRGYTELFIDGKRGRWAAMESAKSMGEEIGEVIGLNRDRSSVSLRLKRKDIILNNGDGFSFVAKDGSVAGFRGDVCSGSNIRCKSVPSLFQGALIFRNINAAFEKEIERQACVRSISAAVDLEFVQKEGLWAVKASARSEDGRSLSETFEAGDQKADNPERMMQMISGQIGKSAGDYRFILGNVSAEEGLPFMSAASLNGIRRRLAEMLDSEPCRKKGILLRKTGKVTKTLPQKDTTYQNNISNHLSKQIYREAGASGDIAEAYELTHAPSAELMRTKYCIRYELGLCPVHQGNKNTKPLFLINNGQRFALHFDCKACEMTLTED
ncbi:MAG: U32 family peptidase [Bacteroidales bacterium]|nr:U32 family peptidase [Bacteroidales bacterium]